MNHKNRPFVGLDSQCLSYLLDSIDGIEEPTDPLAGERKALLRSWFYTPGTFILTQTVFSEVSKIKNIDRREFHKRFTSRQFPIFPVRDLTNVQTRAAQFEGNHPKYNDCLILAEAEELGLDFLITYDDDFLKRLYNTSSTTRLIKPSEYWTYLDIRKGAKTVNAPNDTNPFSKQSWWRW
jgi:predicted nucleic acid-binding protein